MNKYSWENATVIDDKINAINILLAEAAIYGGDVGGICKYSKRRLEEKIEEILEVFSI